jgi:hypothetical protein
LTYASAEGERAGMLLDDKVYDVEASAAFFAMGPVPPRLVAILEAGKASLLRDLHERLIEARQASTGMQRK